MALDTFNYCLNVLGGGSSFTNQSNVRTVSFGNGFQQIGTGGYRTNKRTYSVSYVGREWNAVMQFAFDHIITPFAWTTPQGELKLFVVQQDSINVTPTTKEVQTVNMQFVEVFTSMS